MQIENVIDETADITIIRTTLNLSSGYVFEITVKGNHNRVENNNKQYDVKASRFLCNSS
jgi:hypothetical protein